MLKFLRLRGSIGLVLVGLLAGCASMPASYEAAKDLNLKKYKKVGVLVARVGNKTFYGCPAPIDLTTDYANRKAETAVYFLIDYAKKDVCIENEDRIKESFPNYPKWEFHSKWNAWVKYYKNLTPQVYETVTESLESKGFTVVDLKALFRTKGRNVWDMKVSEVLAESQGACDAVLVLHYTEMGDSYYNFITRTSDEISHTYAEHTGWAGLKYSFAVFDQATRERVLSVWENGIGVGGVLANDPEIKADPILAKKYIVHKTSKGESIECTFSESEILHYVFKTMKHGLAYTTKEGGKEEYVVMKGLVDYFK